MADGDALRRAFATTRDDLTLGVPGHSRLVEQIADPELALRQSLQTVIGARRRRKISTASFPAQIGETAGIDVLMEVPAFRTLVDEVIQALFGLGYLR